METQAITVRLPVEIYERLRREAYETRTSQVSIIAQALADRYEKLDEAEAEALKALDRLSQGGPWQPGERDAAAKTYGDWVTSNPGQPEQEKKR